MAGQGYGRCDAEADTASVTSIERSALTWAAIAKAHDALCRQAGCHSPAGLRCRHSGSGDVDVTRWPYVGMQVDSLAGPRGVSRTEANFDHVDLCPEKVDS